MRQGDSRGKDADRLRLTLDPESRLGAKIKVIGVGGGGSNAVSRMVANGLEGVEFIVANTDAQALGQNPAAVKIQIGQKLTKGLGAGADPNIGREAALEDTDTLIQALAGADMIFAEAVTELAQYTAFRKAVGVPILANITEFGKTPLWTRDELAAAGVDIVLYCCGAYRAMNAAALKVYEAIRTEGTQQSVVERMQSRADLYKYLGYHAYEEKLDQLFARAKKSE